MYNKLLLVCLSFLLIVFIGTGCRDNAAVNQTEEPIEEQELPEERSRTGKEIFQIKEKEFEGSFIVAMDNHKNAYPHSGLDKADKVIEVLAEAGITRILAFFDSEHAEKIGPVRSARYYFVQIAKGYPAGFAHAGGNTDALALIPHLKVIDIDEIYNSPGAFFRSQDRRSPHNLYTSTELLLQNANRRNLPIESLPGLPTGKVIGGEEAQIIDIPYSRSSAYYNVVSYIYEDGKYQRYVNGVVFETKDKVKIQPENVIIMEAQSRHVVTDELQSEIKIIGEGQAHYFVGGKVYSGQWKKEKAEDPFTFHYNNNLMFFKDGKTWIQVVPPSLAVSWS